MAIQTARTVRVCLSVQEEASIHALFFAISKTLGPISDSGRGKKTGIFGTSFSPAGVNSIEYQQTFQQSFYSSVGHPVVLETLLGIADGRLVRALALGQQGRGFEPRLDLFVIRLVE